MASTFLSVLFAVIAGVIVAEGEKTHPPILPLVGGLSDLNANSPIVKDLVKSLPSMGNDMDGLEVAKVVRAQIQVVSGLKYVLSLQIRNKGSDGPATQECIATIWVQLWLEKRSLTSFKCQPIPASAPGLLGGWHKGAITDSVREAANFGLDMLNRRCNCLYRKSIFKIKSVQEQVVAGLLEKITVELVQSSCRNSEKNHGKGLKECPASANAVAKECDMTILYQAWMTPQFRLVHHTC